MKDNKSSYFHICDKDILSHFTELDLEKLQQLIIWTGRETEIWLANRNRVYFNQWVRDMCKNCGIYSENHPQCPPNLPSVASLQMDISFYSLVIIIRYNGFRRFSNYDLLKNATCKKDLPLCDQEELHNRQLLRLKIRYISNELQSSGFQTLPMSAGHCRLCEPPGCHRQTCCKPDESMPAMEGMGIHVFDTMKRLNHVMQYPAPETFSFYSAIFIKKTITP